MYISYVYKARVYTTKNEGQTARPHRPQRTIAQHHQTAQQKPDNKSQTARRQEAREQDQQDQRARPGSTTSKTREHQRARPGSTTSKTREHQRVRPGSKAIEQGHARHRPRPESMQMQGQRACKASERAAAPEGQRARPKSTTRMKARPESVSRNTNQKRVKLDQKARRTPEGMTRKDDSEAPEARQQSTPEITTKHAPPPRSGKDFCKMGAVLHSTGKRERSTCVHLDQTCQEGGRAWNNTVSE